MSFGKNLERIRKGKKMSQAKLGELLGLTQQMVSSYEKDLSSPNVDVLIKIADYFNVSIDSLVEHVVKKPDDDNSQSRFLRYYENLNENDRDKCITIVQTLLEDREMSQHRKSRKNN